MVLIAVERKNFLSPLRKYSFLLSIVLTPCPLMGEQLKTSDLKVSCSLPERLTSLSRTGGFRGYKHFSECTHSFYWKMLFRFGRNDSIQPESEDFLKQISKLLMVDIV